MTPGKTGDHTGVFELESPEGGGTIFVSPPSGLLALWGSLTPGFTRGYYCPTSSMLGEKPFPFLRTSTV